MKLVRRFAALVIASGLSLFASCGGGSSDSDGGDGGPNDTVVSVTLTPGTVALDVGATAGFVAVARDSNGNVVASATFTWESSNPAVASVANGLATGVAAGSVTIVARAGNVASNAAAITVNVGGPVSGSRPACGPGSGNWVSVTAAVANVRVWYDSTRATDQAQAQQVVAAMDNQIWPTLISTLGFKAPLADTAVACNGGDGRLDIYVVASLAERGQTTPGNATGNASEVFISIRDGLAGDALEYTLAHEFMFAVQWSYAMAAPQTSYGWMRNAMANWAVEAVYPGNPLLLADANCHMNSNFLSIDRQAAGACTGNTARTRDHGAYLLYQYIGRTAGNTMVRDLLAATTTVTSALDAIEATLPGGLRALWPQYAKALWNQAPVIDPGEPAFLNWDGLADVPQLAPDHPTTVDGDLGGTTESSTALDPSVDNVSTRFYRFTLSAVETRSLMFHNTFYPLYKAAKKVSVQALWKTEDGTWVEEDWTAKEWIGLCRDVKAQRVAELVIVVASGETGIVTGVVAAEPPTFKRNNIGCWGFSGTAKRTDIHASWSSGTIVLSSTLLFDYKPNGMDSLQYNDAATGRLRVPIAAPLFRRADWTLAEAYSEGGCSYQLNMSATDTTIVLGGLGFGSLVINNFSESLPASLRQPQEQVVGTERGAFHIDAGSQRFNLLGTVSGPQPDCGTQYESALGMFDLTNDSPAAAPVIGSDGRLKGTFSAGAAPDSVIYEWNLAPMREP